jgi:hypothetical protein
MSGLNGTLQIEVSIAPATSRKGGQRRNTGPKLPEPPRVPRFARLMALAVKFQDMVDRGEVRDYADLARLGFVTRARITQIMNMLNLAPDLQEVLLTASALVAQANVPERCLRQVTAVVGWSEQRRLWTELLGNPSTTMGSEGIAARRGR